MTDKLKLIHDVFFEWKRQHTDEDFSRLLTKLFSKSARRFQAKIDIACKNGNHGFNLETWVSGGRIHTRCKNCGANWNNPDYPVNF